MIKELLFFECMVAFCSSSAIKNVQQELEFPGNTVEEVSENQPTDLETAEFKYFGPRVVVINKGYGGYGGYGGCGGGCACGSCPYDIHYRYYGKK